ncbi:MFS transporter, ACS family, hexuronate transporter [Terriglobus roseus]|uniref:MFS transporter, ACS family, hexuronate transporter n=1 Tax=Terriglobus roseus TaxID=392734 RepID=A0A1G7KP13_9BACT|nr:MFS transporter, ACS family, hexuronate transporter [Terriglobus roseus]
MESASPEESVKNRYRWLVVGLLFLATGINYMDRSALGILAHTLDLEFKWSEESYGNIVLAFTLAYGIGYIVAGRIVDWIGTKAGYAIFVFLWTLAAISHSVAGSVIGFFFARLCLGFAESGNFPAAIRAISEWFEPEERALATGIFNSGSNLAALAAPGFIAFILYRYHSWRYAFWGVGALGFVWLLLWLAFPYQRLLRLGGGGTSRSVAIVEASTSARWSDLLKLRVMWAFILVKAMTDPVWWLYLFWLPKFLQQRFQLSVAEIGVPLAVIYCVSSLGALVGGWSAGYLIRRGWDVLSARKAILAVCAACALLLMLATRLQTLTEIVALFSVLTAAHQAWAANLFAANADCFPAATLSSSVGIAGAAGAFGGVVFQKFTGWMLQASHGDYTVVFLVAGMAYAVALLVFHILTVKKAVEYPA